MFLRSYKRKKNGKWHQYFSLVENRRSTCRVISNGVHRQWFDKTAMDELLNTDKRKLFMDKNHSRHCNEPIYPEFPLPFFACPNSNCADFNKFNAGNLSIAERMGKDKAIRRLYCKTCGWRFSETECSLMQEAKLPEAVVVRIIKCLSHGCSIEATADICEVDPRTVEQMLEKAGRRAQDFHQLQLDRLKESVQFL